jgi:hypothetical protein
MMSSTGCLIVMPLVASDRTMLAPFNGAQFERYPSLPELMAVYDRSPAMAVSVEMRCGVGFHADAPWFKSQRARNCEWWWARATVHADQKSLPKETTVGVGPSH